MTTTRTLGEVFTEALGHHQAGRLHDAERLYRLILDNDAEHADTLHLLGVAAHQLGRHEEARRHIQHAIKLNQSAAPYHSNLGNTLWALGRRDDAVRAFRRALKLDPNFADAHGNLGGLLRDIGKPAEAEDHLRTALRLSPGSSDAHYNLGNVLRASGRLREAEASYREAIRLRPDFVEAQNSLGNVLRGLHRPEEAESCFRAALALRPDFADAYNDLGNVLFEMFRPGADECFRTAIRLKPDMFEAHFNLGNVLYTLAQYSESEATLREALRLKPDEPAIHNNLGHCWIALGRPQEAERWFRSAIKLNPNEPVAHSNVIFSMDFADADVATQQAERRRFEAQFGARLAASIKPHRNLPDLERRLRIGYVSADFRHHSAASIFGPVIRRHDHDRFEVFCYSNASPYRTDTITEGLRAASDHWRSIFELSDEDAAERIREDGIDILIDLSGHSAGNRLLVFARKPAPVQISAWGHATGTGLTAMDYLLTDPVTVPEEIRPLFVEKAVDLPCLITYEAPDFAPPARTAAAIARRKITFGSMNRFTKVTERMLDLWARILRAVPEARLLVKDRPFGDAKFRSQFTAAMEARGIAGNRLTMLGATDQTGHLSVYRDIDIALDPAPQGGGVSTLEALWMGVPVVALLGSTVPSRLSGSILTALGLKDWVALDEDEYFQIAVARANDPAGLSRLRGGLRERLQQSDIVDPVRYTAAVERAYRAVWRAWCEATASPPASGT